jgi:23S rRNA pseudouridine2605 synthase/23S rRNA pseudouridine2604 synthase
METPEKIRLQKYLSQAGIASRRKAEEFIARGLVKVNGETATIGMSVDPDNDIVEVGDEAVKETAEFVYYKINKPRGIVTTCVSKGDTGIMDIVDIPERVFPIGRLDKDTTGLLILTNDGRLSNRLMHPSFEHEKEYVVETYGPVDDKSLSRMAAGVTILEGYKTRPAGIERVSSGKFAITLKEGKNRQIRRMVEAVDHEVKRLKRIRIENVKLGDLAEGEYVPLSKKERDELLFRVGLPN